MSSRERSESDARIDRKRRFWDDTQSVITDRKCELQSFGSPRLVLGRKGLCPFEGNCARVAN